MYNEKKGKALFYKSIRLSGVAVLLDYTKMAIKQTITDLKRTDYIRNVATQVIYIIYLIYTLIAGAGYLAANIVLLVLSVSYTVFFLTMTSCGKTPEGKNVKNAGTKIYVWAKRLIKLFTLGLTIYGICTAVEKVTPLSVILAALMIVGWILQIVFEVLIKILTNRVNFILEGLEADLDNMLKPVRSVGNFFKKVTGKEVAPPKEPTKNQLKLKAKVEAFRAEQKRKKEEERLRREAQKSAEKALEKERRREQKQSIRIENQLLRAARKKQSAENSETDDASEILQLPQSSETAPPADSEIAASEGAEKKSSVFSRFRRVFKRAEPPALSEEDSRALYDGAEEPETEDASTAEEEFFDEEQNPVSRKRGGKTASGRSGTIFPFVSFRGKRGKAAGQNQEIFRFRIP